jgi:hypothetical protein
VRPCNSPKAAENRKLKLPENWAFLTAPCIPGASRQLNMVVRLFLEKVMTPLEEENHRLKRELERVQQERDRVKKALGIFSRNLL